MKLADFVLRTPTGCSPSTPSAMECTPARLRGESTQWCRYRSGTTGPFGSSGAQLSFPTVDEHLAAGTAGRYPVAVPPSRVIWV